jgi:hypothetical protein
MTFPVVPSGIPGMALVATTRSFGFKSSSVDSFRGMETAQ